MQTTPECPPENEQHEDLWDVKNSGNPMVFGDGVAVSMLEI
tara:strand:+ start:1237 stop:1359 length:123 start_codon:yes stop_codon:yes gene_type:complete